MSTRTDALAPWHWGTTSRVEIPAKNSKQELWAGLVYLLVWSVLWLAVIVTVLAPLDAVFSGGR